MSEKKCQWCQKEITIAELLDSSNDDFSFGELYFHGICPVVSEKAGE